MFLYNAEELRNIVRCAVSKCDLVLCVWLCKTMASNSPSPSMINRNKEECSTKNDEADETTKLRKARLSKWINKYMKIEMTDGRVLIGTFVCTDKDANIILSACSELFNTEKTGISEEPRMLGLVMIPGRHITSIHLEQMCPIHEFSAI